MSPLRWSCDWCFSKASWPSKVSIQIAQCFGALIMGISSMVDNWIESVWKISNELNTETLLGKLFCEWNPWGVASCNTRNQLISVFIYIFVQSSFHKKNWKNSETKVYLFELALPLFEKENRLHPRAHCLDERKLLASSSGCLKVFFLF